MIVSILIANYQGHEAVELCIESVLKKTTYSDYKIVVFDSSGKDSNDRAYLLNQQEHGNINLYISDKKVRHPAAITKLLAICDTPFACLLDSDVEILRGEWLKVLIDKLQSPNDLGVAKLWHKTRKDGTFRKLPRYIPSCMLLDMRNYRKVADDISWKKKNISPGKYKGSHLFAKDCKQIKGDVGSGLAEKILFDNPEGLVMQDIPKGYKDNYLKHYGGLSALHAKPNHPRVRRRWELVKAHLKALRREN